MPHTTSAGICRLAQLARRPPRAPPAGSCGTGAGSRAGCPGRSGRARCPATPRASAPGVALVSLESNRSVGRLRVPIASSPSTGRAPDARDAVPAVAGQERHRVDQHEPLDALGVALGEGEPDRAPVVHDEAHPLELALVEEALDEAVVLGDRVASESRACPSARSRAGRAPGRRCARGTRASRRSCRARRAGTAAARLVTPAGAGALRQKTAARRAPRCDRSPRAPGEDIEAAPRRIR